MDEAFVFDRYVTGKAFAGRLSDCAALGNLILKGGNVCIYDAPKTGKTSLIRQTLNNLVTSGSRLTEVYFNMLGVRTVEDFVTGLASSVLVKVCNGTSDFQKYIDGYLPGGNYFFEDAGNGDFGKSVRIHGKATSDDLLAALKLPYAVSAESGLKLCVILDEFHTLTVLDGWEGILHRMEGISMENRDKTICSYIFCGSSLNAMKHIFAYHKYFFRDVVNVPLSPLTEQEVIEYIVGGFRPTGKVIEKDLIQRPYRIFRGNMWYLNQFAFFCGTRSIGYISDKTIYEAIETVIALNEPRFRRTVSSLTVYQLSFLKAVLRGETRFSSSEVIAKYGFNSSANVKRLREALLKKEIITFREKDEPVVIDPLFEYWFRRELL